MANRRTDPSKTATLRAGAVAETKRRFKRLRREVLKLIVKQDALGLKVGKATGVLKLLGNTIWAARTNPDKVKEFRAWLQEMVDTGILETTGSGDPWTNKYIESAYRKGLVRSYVDTRRADLDKAEDVLGMTQSEFLGSTFRTTESVQRLELLYTRTWTDLEGVTNAMQTAMSRSVTQGLADGLSPRDIGKNLARDIDNIGINRATTIARTEIARAQSEGQLDGFEDAGILELTVLAEWSTAGDDKVCPLCLPLEDKVFTIKEARSLLPRHPNCRCAWIPANVGEETPKGRGGRPAAVRKSLKAEGQGTQWKGQTLTKKKSPPTPSSV